MNPHDDTQHDDAEFEAFLRGEGELSRALSALPQPAPPDDLTAAILARAEADQDPASSTNDAVIPDAGPRPAPHYLRRVRVPLAIAASFALALSLTMQWMGQPSPEQQTVNEALAPASKAPITPVAPQSPALPSSPVSQPAATPHQPTSAPTLQAAPQPAKIEVEQASDLAAPAPAENKPPLVMPAPAPIAPPPPAPAPMAAPVMARATSSEAAPMAAPIAARAPAPAAKITPEADEQAKQQIILIEELLKADLPRDALEQWKEFRKAYPAYPVSESLATRMKALEQQ